MLLNNYTQPAPYSLQNRQGKNLSTEQSIRQTELELIQQPLIQPLTLNLLNQSNFFTMDQPFLPDERMGTEMHNAIPPLFVDTNNYSVAQPSFQTSNNPTLSQVSEACAAISYAFPNQFTWNPLPISGPDLVPQPISHVNLPAAQPIAPAKTMNDAFFASLRKTRKKQTPQRLSKRPPYQPIAPRLPFMQGKELTTPDLVPQRISHVNLPTAQPIAPAKTINDALLPVSHKTRNKPTAQRRSKNISYQPIAPRLPFMQGKALTTHGTFYGADHSLSKPLLPYKNLIATNQARKVEKIGQALPNTLHEKKEKVEESTQHSLQRKKSPTKAAQHRASQKKYREKQKECVKEKSKELDALKNAIEQFSEQIEQFQLPPKLAASKMSGLEILGVLKSEILEMLKQSTKLN